MLNTCALSAFGSELIPRLCPTLMKCIRHSRYVARRRSAPSADLQDAWNNLLRTFPAGRVLVVSNSAGTKKDPGGIAVRQRDCSRLVLFPADVQAEAVSLNLRCPVLMRSTPKPGCSPEIISYFRGQLGKPSTLRGQIHEVTESIKQLEKADEDEIMGKYIQDMEQQPLLGPVTGRREAKSKGDALRDKMILHQASSSLRTAEKEQDVVRAEAESTDRQAEEPLRILVVGDRLFTDTLLAHRLSVMLPKPATSLPSVLSIHTTTLPQPKDVRFLRWIEDKLSQRRLKEGKTDWGRYVRDPYADLSIPPLAQIEAQPKVTLKERWNDLKEDVARSRLQWDPRTWRAFDLAVGAGRGIRWMGRKFWALVRQDGEVFRQAMSAPKEEVKVVQAVVPPAASTEKSIKSTA